MVKKLLLLLLAFFFSSRLVYGQVTGLEHLSTQELLLSMKIELNNLRSQERERAENLRALEAQLISTEELLLRERALFQTESENFKTIETSYQNLLVERAVEQKLLADLRIYISRLEEEYQTLLKKLKRSRSWGITGTIVGTVVGVIIGVAVSK